MNPIICTDAYKISHPEQYPPGTEYVYSNITARKSRIEGVNSIVVLGIRYFVEEYLHGVFNRDFFKRDKSVVIAELDSFFNCYFGPDAVDTSKYADLWELGYLPLRIRALPEGARCPTGVPFITIENTNPQFYWLTNFIETLSQCILWNPITSATIASRYRDLLDKYADLTSEQTWFVDFQGHNFSMRGMSSLESSTTTDLGHLLFFKGSDTLTGNFVVKRLYDCDESAVSCSVPATEHAVMCAGGMLDERETFRRLICDVYPTGVVSIVSDTWDLWNVLTSIAPSLSQEIMARDGKVVFRPDSGDPIMIVCGYRTAKTDKTSDEVIKIAKLATQSELFDSVDALECADGVVVSSEGKILNENEVLGCVRLLDREFGSTTNSKGYKELNPKVGLIYGDSITYQRAERICERLEAMGYASTNVVFGIGSYTYQYNTRDTFSIACKATWAQVKGESRAIFKNPVTDDGTKKSACGRLLVYRDGDRVAVRDNVSLEEEEATLLECVFEDGKSFFKDTWEEIRERARNKVAQPST